MIAFRRYFKTHPSFLTWLFFTGLSTFILFFISPDSYFNDLHSRIDSAWFFMAGKAWMNGLVPYIDFTDSKGPLLWLIYGIGYLFSHTDYLGIFWISCIWYGLTYFFTYKTSRLFLPDDRKALLCTVLMSLAFFNPWYHNEIRAEDFCLLFLTLSLYRVCILLYTDPGEKELKHSFFILGLCFGALFLIKFNIAAMQAVLILAALIYLVREKRSWTKPLICGLGGLAVVWIPFLVYFLFVGNVSEFLQEYFINTLGTVNQPIPNEKNILLNALPTNNPFIGYLWEWGDLIYRPHIGSLFILLMLGGILFLATKRKYRWIPLLCSIFIFAITMRHHNWTYYFTSCSFLLVFLFVGILSLFPKPLSRFVATTLSISAICIAILFHILSFNFKTLYFNDNVNQREYYRVAYVMAQIKKPTLINAYLFERGFGAPAETLPAGKDWALQLGYTQKMLEEHTALILSGKADFIIVDQKSFDNPDYLSEQQILDLGYAECLRFGKKDDLILLSKHPGLIIPEKVLLSRKDLFFKNYKQRLFQK